MELTSHKKNIQLKEIKLKNLKLKHIKNTLQNQIVVEKLKLLNKKGDK